MKRCFKCGRDLPLDEFYRHPMMADGRLGKCKDCTKADVSGNYRARQPQYSAYDRERNVRPARREARRVYHQRHRERHPERERARQAVSNALRDGRLMRRPCEKCGSPKSQAHHPDHSKPLDVQWLCLVHHREADRELHAQH